MTSLCCAGSGVEILVNEPYTDGPGAGGSNSGQFTHKVRIIMLSSLVWEHFGHEQIDFHCAVWVG